MAIADATVVFADAALPHRHHDAVPHLFEFIDEGSQWKSGMNRVDVVLEDRFAHRRYAVEHAS